MSLTETVVPFSRRMTILTPAAVKALGGRNAFTRVLSRKYLRVELGQQSPLNYAENIPQEVFIRFLDTDLKAVICHIDSLRFLDNGELCGRVIANHDNYGDKMAQLLRADTPKFCFYPRVIQSRINGKRVKEVVAFDLGYL